MNTKKSVCLKVSCHHSSRLLTYGGCALHPRGCVHGVTINGELRQHGPNKACHTVSSVDTNANINHLIAVRHADL
jgi:hypothetical protein